MTEDDVDVGEAATDDFNNFTIVTATSTTALISAKSGSKNFIVTNITLDCCSFGQAEQMS